MKVESIPCEVEDNVADWLWFVMSSYVVVGYGRNLVVHESEDGVLRIARNYLEMFGKKSILGNPAGTEPDMICKNKRTTYCDEPWSKR